MNVGLVFGFFLTFLLWGIWFYQLRTGKLLYGFWRVWTTEKEKPDLYNSVLVVQGLGFLIGSILLIWDALH